MSLPFFYIATHDPDSQELVLDEDNSRHVVQVLRMQSGESLRLTDGKGALLTATIVGDHKKKCRVAITSSLQIPPPDKKLTIAISPLKNASRFEWFVEKATEVGVSAVIPLVCDRTERTFIRLDRLRQIAVSAMLQSQQCWLPQIAEPTPFPEVIRSDAGQTRYIAHCLETPAQAPTLPRAASAAMILIGPEGDFTPKEIETAVAAGFQPVTLGPNRLRTETAGMVAATLLCLG